MGSRIVGIDFGLKRIGIALSDESKILATPYKTFLAEKKAEITAQKLVEELKKDAQARKYTFESLVIGLPLMLNGTKGFLADEVLHFAECLKKYIDCPIYTWDERLTSAQAERSLKEFDLSRKKRAQIVDSVAAVIILQNYLDRLNLK